jgi:hypothetical protein
MFRVEAITSPVQHVDLIPDVPNKLSKAPRGLTSSRLFGAKQPPTRRLTARLLLGTPVVSQLTQSVVGDDRDLAAFIKNKARKHDFYLVLLAPTFVAKKNEPVLEAEISVLFTAASGKDPIAWSMEPLKAATYEELSDTGGLNASLNFVLSKVGSKTSSTRKTRKERVFIEGLGLLTSGPQWRFWRTSEAEIRGSIPLRLVVQSDAKARWQGRLSITAQVQRHHGRIIPYRADESAEPMTFSS